MDTMLKILLAFAGVLALTIAAVVYMAVSDVGRRPIPETSSDPVVRCDASSFEGAICPDNFYCQYDTCVPVEPVTTCAEGESCRECECDTGLVCYQFRCTAPSRVDWKPLVCEEDERLSKAVATLADKCNKRKKNIDELASAGSCTPADWEMLAMEDAEFDLLLAAFPGRFAVHFPPGRPFLKSDAWPSPVERDHLIRQIQGFRGTLRAAKQIFVIGRASPDGASSTNHSLAVRRMNLLSSLIEAVIYEGMTPTQRDQQRIRIRSFSLPTDRPIQPKTYRATYLLDPGGGARVGPDPLVTWDDASREWFAASLANEALLSATNTGDWQRLNGAVNRVVLVIPIPCLGDEPTRPRQVLQEAAKGVPG